MTTLSGKPTPLHIDKEDSAVLPSILGILSFILVVIVIVGCYIFNKNSKFCHNIQVNKRNDKGV